NTDRKLAALETAVKMLGSLPEKKALVYFASGMSRTGMDNQAQLRATTNAAIRSNVAFYPVDARGLVAQAPLGDATKASPRRRRAGAECTPAVRSAQRKAIFRASRRRCTHWPRIPAAKRCWITTIFRWESSRPKKASRATTSWATTAPTARSTAA